MNENLDDTLDMLIFGGSGDLSFRKLLPALYMAHIHDRLPKLTRIIGVGRHDWTLAQYQAFLHEHAVPFVDSASFQPDAWRDFMDRIAYCMLDASQAADYARLKDCLRPGVQRIYYLATAPSLFTSICSHLGQAGLIGSQDRVVLEKPLGTDLKSARQINAEVARHFEERQIYRIDHYLGKETVQNLMVLRFGNAIFEPLWRAQIGRAHV